MKISNLDTSTTISPNNFNNTSKNIVKTTSDSIFDITKPVKPELLEYTWISIVLVWVALAVWINQIWKKKNLKEN